MCLSFYFGAGKEYIREVTASGDKFIKFNKKQLANHELLGEKISSILLSLDNSTPLRPKRLQKALGLRVEISP